MNKEQFKLLEKFLEGKCTDSELAIVKKILDTEKGKLVLSEIMESRDILAEMIGTEQEDLTEKVQSLKQEVHQRIREVEPIKLQPPAKSWRQMIAKAAVWIGILLTLGVIAYQFSRTGSEATDVRYVQEVNELGKPVHYTLPDGSEIYLASGSYITYPEQFSGAERHVELVGEAFFDIKRDESRPFTVKSGEIRTRVLGTSFRISAFEGEMPEVAVATGKVSVSTGDGSSNKELGTLTAGLKLTYDALKGVVEQGNIDINNLNNWKDGDIIFANKPLELVALQLQRRFGVEVNCLDKEVSDYRVSASFASDESIEQILQLLSGMGKFEYTKKSKSIYELYKPKK